MIALFNKYKKYITLIIWIIFLVGMGSLIGDYNPPNTTEWYLNLQQSPLTPPGFVFGIAWTILYTLIAISGWLIWYSNKPLKLIKYLYIAQMLLNWSWMPIFVTYQMTGLALFILVVMDIIVASIIFFSCKQVKYVSWALTPYLCWLLFATYLNSYIVLFN